MAFLNSNKAFRAALLTFFLSLFVVSCGKKNTGNQNKQQGPVPAQQASTPPKPSTGLNLANTVWETDCINNSTYTMEFFDNSQINWIYTEYKPADSAGGSSCEQPSGPSSVIEYEYDYGAVGSLSTPPNATPFDFYSPDGFYEEQNFIVYNAEAGTIALGDWTQFDDGSRPTNVGYTFRRIE